MKEQRPMVYKEKSD